MSKIGQCLFCGKPARLVIWYIHPKDEREWVCKRCAYKNGRGAEWRVANSVARLRLADRLEALATKVYSCREEAPDFKMRHYLAFLCFVACVLLLFCGEWYAALVAFCFAGALCTKQIPWGL